MRNSFYERRRPKIETSVTWQNYPKRAVQCAELHDLKNGDYPIISRRDEPEEWRYWEAYFRAIGMVSSADAMSNRSTWTVPVKWPWHFDSSTSKDKLEPFIEEPKSVKTEGRKLPTDLREMVDGMGKKGKKGKL